jgi:hypothetical protein
METKERRAVMEEQTGSIRSLRLRAYCEQRAEAYWKARKTDSNLDWRKYHEISAKFDRLCYRRQGLRKSQTQPKP